MTTTLLLIEPDTRLQEQYASILREADYSVEVISAARTALALVQTLCPRLIVINLAAIDPIEVDIIPLLRRDADGNPVPIIIYSPLGETNQIQRSLRLGADDYFIIGTSRPAEVLRLVRIHLAKRNYQLKPQQ